MKLFWSNLLTVKFGPQNMHGFYLKVKKERKYWVGLIWVLRWLIKCFRVLASIESLALTLSYSVAIFMFFKYPVNYLCFGYVRNR